MGYRWRFLAVPVFVLIFCGVPTAGFSLGNAENGKILVHEEIECLGCHTIDHKITDKKPVGPDLTQTTIRRSSDWLMTFLTDPSKLVDGTKMPMFDWTSDEEINDVIAYLETIKKPVDKSGSGEQLVKEYDCRACHKIGDISQGGLEGPAWRDRFPDLTHIGSKLKSDWMKKWLKDPQAIRPGTFMPTFNLTDKEINAIVKYLASLK